MKCLLPLVAITVLLAACNKQLSTTGGDNRKVVTNASAAADTSNSPKAEDTNTVIIDLNPAPHESYQTVDKDGCQWRQGRFPTGNHGGKLVAATVSGDPKSFNPWAAEDALSLEICDLMFRGLVDIDAYTGEIIPDLAAETSSDPDKVTYTLRLRKGLKWTDGTDISAADVAFTWNKIISQDFGNPTLRESLLIDGKLPSCTALDALTVKFVTPRPYSPFLRNLAAVKIAPKHTLETVISSSDARSEFKRVWAADKDTSNIVSNGPFKLYLYEPAVKVELERSNCFYMIDKNGSTLPYLDRLVYSLLPEAGAVVLAFGKNEADLAVFRPRDLDWLRGQQAKQNFRLHNLGPSLNTSFLAFNMNQRKDSWTKKPIVDPVKSSWFNDKNFRQAINHTINREKIVKDFFKGAGSAIFSSQSGCSPYYNKACKPFEADSKYAMELLAATGFSKKQDGFLYDRSGNKVEFTLSYPKKSHLYENIAEALKSDLKDLGITVKPEALELNQFEETLKGARPWEAQLNTISSDPVEPNAEANLMRSNGRLHIFDQREADKKGEVIVEDARPWELDIDRIYELASAEFDREKRKELYARAQSIIYDEAPFIYLISPDVLVGARNTVRNFAPAPFSQSCMGLHNAEEICIDLTRDKTEEEVAAKK